MCYLWVYLYSKSPETELLGWKGSAFAILMDNSRLLPIKGTPVNVTFENT